MKLLYAQPSPFARKVRVLAFELGLHEQLELTPVAVLPTNENTEVTAHNPLGKIPVLLTDDGEALYDSRVICAYLQQLVSGSSPVASSAHWQQQTLIAMADGVMEATLSIRYEQAIRPADKQWPAWTEGQLGKIKRALAVLESCNALSQPEVTATQVGIGCALGYLDFRLPDLGWRSQFPALAAFYADFSQRPSMLTTQPA